ncbi:unnamed protein product [Protopolystoma xenopodis]|uniref:Secreted protein n=1 Tax=Protopolystoma xenopodis TaxID=117903 RepID=A0A448WDJ7_9PLAT|nr:unnamed protein product [Protopolystoma xenopodis]
MFVAALILQLYFRHSHAVLERGIALHHSNETQQASHSFKPAYYDNIRLSRPGHGRDSSATGFLMAHGVGLQA